MSKQIVQRALNRKTKSSIVLIGDTVCYKTGKHYPNDRGMCQVVNTYFLNETPLYVVKRHLADRGLVLAHCELIEVFKDNVKGKWVKLN